MIPSIMSGSLIRETPPWARMSAGTRSRAMTATAPASSAIFACSGVTTSMMTPPLSISAMPRLTRGVPVADGDGAVVLLVPVVSAGLDTVDLTGETGGCPSMVGPDPDTRDGAGSADARHGDYAWNREIGVRRHHVRARVCSDHAR